jgi:glycine cleavage system regulatory protein
MERNYKEDRRIDYNNLHYEWIIQSELIGYYGDQVALAKEEVRTAKEAMDVAKNKAILSSFDKGLKVDAAKAEAELNPEYRASIRAYNEACHKQNLVETAFDAIHSRKASLENLVELHGQQYFSHPIEKAQFEAWQGQRFSAVAESEVREQANEACKVAATKRQRKD